MALLLKDRVKESTTTTGTGTLTLVAAPSGYRRFSAALSDGDTTYYCIESGSQWEVGLGTYSANTLTRDTVLASSNAGSKIEITASRSYVFITYAADKAVLENAAGEIRVDSALRFSDNSSQSTAFLGEVDFSGVSGLPANTILGNNTGSTGDALALTPSQVRAVLGLATTDAPTFAGLTLNGNLLFGTTNSYDIGNGTYNPRTVRAATSFIGPNTGNTGPWLQGGMSHSGIGVQDDTTSIWRYSTRIFGADGAGICAYNVTPIGLSRTQTPQVYLYCEGDYMIGLTRPDGVTYGTLHTAVVSHPSAALTLGNSTYGVWVPGVAHFGSPTGTIAKVGTSPATAWTMLGESNSGGWGLDVGGLVVAQYSRLGFWTSGTKWVEIGATGTTTFGGDVTISQNVSGSTLLKHFNTNSGTTSGAYIIAGYGASSTQHVFLAGLSSGYTTTGGFVQSGAVLGTSMSGGLSILSQGSGNLRFYAGGFTDAYKRAEISASTGTLALTGNLSFTSSGATIGNTTGELTITPGNGFCDVYKSGSQVALRAWNTAGTHSASFKHESGNGAISTTSGSLNLVPAGGTVAVTGAVTTTGDISMSKTSAQGYIRAYSPNGACNIRISGVNSNQGYIETNVGSIFAIPYDGLFGVTSGDGVTNTQIRSYSANGSKYTTLTHDGTNGIISTSSGTLIFSSYSGYAAIYKSGSDANLFLINGANTAWVTVSSEAISTNVGNLSLRPSGGTTAVVTYGDISMQKATQGYIYAYSTGGVNYARMFDDGTNGVVETNSGDMYIRSNGTGVVNMYTSSASSMLRVWASAGTNYSQLTHDGSNGTISTSSGEIILSPWGGTTSCYVSGTNSTLFVKGATGTGYIALAHNDTSYGQLAVSTGDLLFTATSSLFCFGGRTSSYPAIKRSSTAIAFRLADDTADAPITAAAATFSGIITGSSTGSNYLAGKLGIGVNPATSKLEITSSVTTDTIATFKGMGAHTGLLTRWVEGSTEVASMTPTGKLTLNTILQTAEITGTPSGTTQTLTLNDGNYQTLDLTSSTGDTTVTLTVPTSSSKGSILIKQHATTARDITWAVSVGSIVWLGSEPSWNADATSSYREVSWRFNGTDIFLSASGVS